MAIEREEGVEEVEKMEKQEKVPSKTRFSTFARRFRDLVLVFFAFFEHDHVALIRSYCLQLKWSKTKDFCIIGEGRIFLSCLGVELLGE